MYIYPSNLKARASILFWTLRDMAISVILLLLGALALTQAGTPTLLAVAAAYIFLSIRHDDISVLDFIYRAWRFLFAGQQLFRWRCENELA